MDGVWNVMPITFFKQEMHFLAALDQISIALREAAAGRHHFLNRGLKPAWEDISALAEDPVADRLCKLSHISVLGSDYTN